VRNATGRIYAATLYASFLDPEKAFSNRPLAALAVWKELPFAPVEFDTEDTEEAQRATEEFDSNPIRFFSVVLCASSVSSVFESIATNVC
jgi:hypothetical protein